MRGLSCEHIASLSYRKTSRRLENLYRWFDSLPFYLPLFCVFFSVRCIFQSRNSIPTIFRGNEEIEQIILWIPEWMQNTFDERICMDHHLRCWVSWIFCFWQVRIYSRLSINRRRRERCSHGWFDDTLPACSRDGVVYPSKTIRSQSISVCPLTLQIPIRRMHAMHILADPKETPWIRNA